MRTCCGAGRSGSRIKEAFSQAVRDLTQNGLERDRDGFLRTTLCSLQTVRVPTDNPETERPAKHVPQQELQLAVRRIVQDAHTAEPDAISLHVARLFGWQRRGPDVQAALEDAIDALVNSGALRVDGGLVTSVKP